MNYDPKKNAQILPDSWRKVVPETYDRIKENQSKGDFLAVIGRSHPNERKMNDLIRKWATLGMISHKKSLITIFGHKHKIKNFIKKIGIFH